jgi:hypothetical protein
MVTGVNLTPRANYSLHETQHAELNILVLAPLRNGRRSVAVGEMLRRRTVVDGDRALRRDLGLDRMLKRCARSPGCFL